jgi:hypothetical protein
LFSYYVGLDTYFTKNVTQFVFFNHTPVNI